MRYFIDYIFIGGWVMKYINYQPIRLSWSIQFAMMFFGIMHNNWIPFIAISIINLALSIAWLWVDSQSNDQPPTANRQPTKQ
jgi:hypothetical protein